MSSGFRMSRPGFAAAPVVVLVVLLMLVVAAPQARGQGGPTGAETIGVTIPPSGSLVCSREGNRLPNGATVHRGDRLHCVGSGFKPGEPVQISVHGTVIATVTTDSHGAVTYDYTVGNDVAPGTYTLTFTGKVSGTVAGFGFVVVVGKGSQGGGGPGAGGQEPGGGGHGPLGGLAMTGSNLVALVLAGLGLIGMGVALHRRRHEREAA